jgi:hypothetical protein
MPRWMIKISSSFSLTFLSISAVLLGTFRGRPRLAQIRCDPARTGTGKAW